MGKYSIKELEKLSGIKAHTIRIWEKRYNLIEPERTATNIRFYSDNDLKKIINVSTLNASGLKISAIAQLNDHDLTDKVYALSLQQTNGDVHIDKLITSMLDLNEQQFIDDLNLLESKFGFEETIVQVVYPFLVKIGVLWQTENITPAHEHFISNIIRQRIIVGIASLKIPGPKSKRVILYLPENELHEIALLFFHYMVRKAGCLSFYLGQSVPLPDLLKVYAIHKPHALVTTFTSFPTPQNLNSYLRTICTEFSESKIFASGSILKNSSFHYHPNLKVFETTSQLKELLKTV